MADTERRRQRAKDNGNTEQGDGYTYRGRGYVQVTWKNNYRAIGAEIGVDLVREPDRMLEPEIAAWATVYGMERGIFTGKRLSDYVNGEGGITLMQEGLLTVLIKLAQLLPLQFDSSRFSRPRNAEIYGISVCRCCFTDGCLC